MKLLDLFSGIGGFSLAARWTGQILTAAFCETDPYCVKVLEKNFPGVPIHGDIRNLKGADVGPADIVSGGFPCQPFSVAGKRCGTEDDRYLWPEMLRVVSDVRSTWVVGENVDGLVRMGVQLGVPQVASRNLKRGPRFDCLRGIFTRQEIMLLFSILEDLEALGYGAVPLVIPACGVDAPHLRYRVWIVAHSERARAGDRPFAAGMCGWVAAEKGGAALRQGYGEALPDRDNTASANVADSARIPSGREEQRAFGERVGERGEQSGEKKYPWDGFGTPHWIGEDVAHPPGRGLGAGGGAPGSGGYADLRGQVVADADRPRRGEQRRAVSIGEEHPPPPQRGGRWLPEPAICRVAHGIPARVDRLRSLGNAIVPQVAYRIFEGILKAEGRG